MLAGASQPQIENFNELWRLCLTKYNLIVASYIDVEFSCAGIQTISELNEYFDGRTGDLKIEVAKILKDHFSDAKKPLLAFAAVSFLCTYAKENESIKQEDDEKIKEIIAKLLLLTAAQKSSAPPQT